VLYTYTNKSFIVTSSRLSYVRKPQRISLSLGQDCEIAPEYHQLICDLTSEYFKAMIADPNWEVKLKDKHDQNTSINSKHAYALQDNFFKMLPGANLNGGISGAVAYTAQATFPLFQPMRSRESWVYLMLTAWH